MSDRKSTHLDGWTTKKALAASRSSPAAPQSSAALPDASEDPCNLNEAGSGWLIENFYNRGSHRAAQNGRICNKGTRLVAHLIWASSCRRAPSYRVYAVILVEPPYVHFVLLATAMPPRWLTPPFSSSSQTPAELPVPYNAAFLAELAELISSGTSHLSLTCILL